MKRSLLLPIIGVSALILAVFLANQLVSSNKTPQRTVAKTVKSVFVHPAENTSIPLVVSSNGRLIARQRVELFSEVQGVLKFTGKAFRSGQTYKKGEVILALDDSEFAASVRSAKSNFLNILSTSLADIELDFPSIYPKWESYVRAYNIDAPTAELPSFDSEKERFFISGRGILNAYYNVLNLEVRLAKFMIIAPFDGALSLANVTEGSLVRAAQPLGTFIEKGVFEMPVSVPATYAENLRIGKEVTLHSLESDTKYEGKVVRINPSIDQTTQTIEVTLSVRNQRLREGQYLTAEIEMETIDNVIEIDRSLVLDSQEIFVVREGLLALVPVEVIHYTENTAIVSGVANGEKVLSKTLPGAFKAQPVKIIED
jgi:membrane fusion protein (multidrug efflux system)